MKHLRRCAIAALMAAQVVTSACNASPCGTHPLARIGVRNVLGFMVMQGQVGTQPVSLLLDSGADTGLVTDDAVRSLHLPQAGPHSMLRGTGGETHAHPQVKMPDLHIGGLTIAGVTLPVGTLPALPNVQPPVIGLLGADVLARFDVALALDRGEMTLYPAGACGGSAPWPDAVAMPARRFGPRLAVTAVLDGQPMLALLDTGAHALILSTHRANALGALPDILAAEPGGLSGGIDQPAVPFHWHKFARLTLGPDTITDPMLTVTELNDVADMLIGSTWFENHHVWMSWADQIVWVTHAR